jgi:hypothetical protein
LLDGGFFFRSGSWLLFKTFVELLQVVRNLAEHRSLFGNPVTAFFEQFLFDVIAFNNSNLLDKFFALLFVPTLITELNHFRGVHSPLSSYKRVVFPLHSGLGAAYHA